ncbi:UNVERIFIED_ORG: hypothetical protein M2193_000457 [Bradyrhizobium japonicum]|uniref:hypothetical protein n=1 Tax=Bradyrhizobium TaxID=374 RepID=UPI0035D4B748
MNSIDRATLKRLRSNYTQTAGLLRQATFYVRIAALPDGTVRRVGNTVELSIDQAYITGVYEKTILLVEDEHTDGPLLKFLLNNLSTKVVGQLPLSFQPLHGGGERIPDIARSRVRERRIVCAVVDTDKKFPDGTPSLKMKRLGQISTDEDWPLIFVNATPCKETENLIPVEVVALLDCARERAADISIVTRIGQGEQKAGNPATDAFWLYFDIKDGCNHEQVGKLAHEPERAWILAKVAHGTKQQDFKIAGFGPHVVPQVLSTNTACARFRDELRRKDWWDVFGSFISDITWLTVGGVRQFT